MNYLLQEIFHRSFVMKTNVVFCSCLVSFRIENRHWGLLEKKTKSNIKSIFLLIWKREIIQNILLLLRLGRKSFFFFNFLASTHCEVVACKKGSQSSKIFYHACKATLNLKICFLVIYFSNLIRCRSYQERK